MLLALAVEHPFHARQVLIQPAAKGLLEPFALAVRFEWPPFGLVRVEVFEHLVQKPSTLHQHGTWFGDEPRMVAVPVQARALQIVVQRRRAEVVDVHAQRVAVAAVRLEWLAGERVGEKADVKAKRRSALIGRVVEWPPLRGDEHLGFTSQQHV